MGASALWLCYSFAMTEAHEGILFLTPCTQRLKPALPDIKKTALISNMLQDRFHCPCLYLHLSLGQLF